MQARSEQQIGNASLRAYRKDNRSFRRYRALLSLNSNASTATIAMDGGHLSWNFTGLSRHGYFLPGDFDRLGKSARVAPRRVGQPSFASVREHWRSTVSLVPAALVILLAAGHARTA